MIHREVLRFAQSVPFAPVVSRGGSRICTASTITKTPPGWSSGIPIHPLFISNDVWICDSFSEEILEPSGCREPPVPLWCASRVPLEHVERLRDDKPAYGYSAPIRSIHEQVQGHHSVGQIHYARLHETEEIGNSVWVEFRVEVDKECYQGFPLRPKV